MVNFRDHDDPSRLSMQKKMKGKLKKLQYRIFALPND